MAKRLDLVGARGAMDEQGHREYKCEWLHTALTNDAINPVSSTIVIGKGHGIARVEALYYTAPTREAFQKTIAALNFVALQYQW